MSGIKYDSGKMRWSLLPAGVIVCVLAVLEAGALKYAADNWKKVKNARGRYYDAAMRHIEARRAGERVDPETKLPHLAHAICCLMFWLWFDLREKPRKS